jgi:hypothetical protein
MAQTCRLPFVQGLNISDQTCAHHVIGVSTAGESIARSDHGGKLGVLECLRSNQ